MVPIYCGNEGEEKFALVREDRAENAAGVSIVGLDLFDCIFIYKLSSSLAVSSSYVFKG